MDAPECPHCASASRNREQIGLLEWLCRCCGKTFRVVEKDTQGIVIDGP